LEDWEEKEERRGKVHRAARNESQKSLWDVETFPVGECERGEGGDRGSGQVS